MQIRFLYGTSWVIFWWGDLKTGFCLVFNLQFLVFTYLQTWDAPARAREYPIKLFKVESLPETIDKQPTNPSYIQQSSQISSIC